MHKVFGQKENVEYTDRPGAYLLPVRDKQIAVVKTSKGYFFIGGGLLSKQETDEACIRRECMEETGFEAEIFNKICSAEMYTEHSLIGHFHPIQTYYCGKLTQKTAEPKESDHSLQWIYYRKLQGNMYVPMQNWAFEQFIKQYFYGVEETE